MFLMSGLVLYKQDELTALFVDPLLNTFHGEEWWNFIQYAIGSIVAIALLSTNFLVSKPIGRWGGRMGVFNFGFFVVSGFWAFIAYFVWGFVNSGGISAAYDTWWLPNEVDNEFVMEVLILIYQYSQALIWTVEHSLYVLPVFGWLWSSLYMISYRKAAGGRYTDNVLDLM